MKALLSVCGNLSSSPLTDLDTSQITPSLINKSISLFEDTIELKQREVNSEVQSVDKTKNANIITQSESLLECGTQSINSDPYDSDVSLCSTHGFKMTGNITNKRKRDISQNEYMSGENNETSRSNITTTQPIQIDISNLPSDCAIHPVTGNLPPNAALHPITGECGKTEIKKKSKLFRNSELLSQTLDLRIPEQNVGIKVPGPSDCDIVMEDVEGWNDVQQRISIEIQNTIGENQQIQLQNQVLDPGFRQTGVNLNLTNSEDLVVLNMESSTSSYDVLQAPDPRPKKEVSRYRKQIAEDTAIKKIKKNKKSKRFWELGLWDDTIMKQQMAERAARKETKHIEHYNHQEKQKKEALEWRASIGTGQRWSDAHGEDEGVRLAYGGVPYVDDEPLPMSEAQKEQERRKVSSYRELFSKRNLQVQNDKEMPKTSIDYSYANQQNSHHANNITNNDVMAARAKEIDNNQQTYEEVLDSKGIGSIEESKDNPVREERSEQPLLKERTEISKVSEESSDEGLIQIVAITDDNVLKVLKEDQHTGPDIINNKSHGVINKTINIINNDVTNDDNVLREQTSSSSAETTNNILTVIGEGKNRKRVCNEVNSSFFCSCCIIPDIMKTAKKEEEELVDEERPYVSDWDIDTYCAMLNEKCRPTKVIMSCTLFTGYLRKVTDRNRNLSKLGRKKLIDAATYYQKVKPLDGPFTAELDKNIRDFICDYPTNEEFKNMEQVKYII